MELVLAYTLNIVNFALQDPASYFSLVLMIVVGLGLLSSFFWKIEDEEGQVHYGLLYNYEIVYRGDEKIKESGLRALMPLLSKIVIPILVPVFNRRMLLQSSMFTFIFAGKLICQLTMAHRRKIHLFNEIFITSM